MRSVSFPVDCNDSKFKEMSGYQTMKATAILLFTFRPAVLTESTLFIQGI